MQGVAYRLGEDADDQRVAANIVRLPILAHAVVARTPVTWRLKTTELTRGRDSRGTGALLISLQPVGQAVTNKSVNRQPRQLGAGTEDAFPAASPMAACGMERLGFNNVLPAGALNARPIWR